MWDIQQFMSLGFINRYIAKQRWGRLWPYTHLSILFGLGRKWTPIPCQGLTFKAMNCRLSKYDPVLVHVAFCCLPGISPLNVLFLVKQSRKNSSQDSLYETLATLADGAEISSRNWLHRYRLVRSLVDWLWNKCKFDWTCCGLDDQVPPKLHL